MLSGNNGILQRATDAKTNTEKAQIIERAQTDILGQQTENKGANITKEQLARILNKYFNPTEPNTIPDEVSSTSDIPLTTIDEKYTINLSEIFKGKFSIQNVVTLGEKYDEYENNNNSLIGKTINYTSVNHDSDIQTAGGWIILGKQVNEQGKNDVIITTKNPINITQQINYTLVEWTKYETTINNACKTYIGETGNLGTKVTAIKEVRNITLNDINNAVGFSEIVNSITLGGTSNNFAYPKEDGSGWIVSETDASYDSWTYPIEGYYYYNDGGTYKYGSTTNGYSDEVITLGKPNNMTYIIANNEPYLISSRSVVVDSTHAEFNRAIVRYSGVWSYHSLALCRSNAWGGQDYGSRESELPVRPIVVLSSETPWSDVESLIGSSATY